MPAAIYDFLSHADAEFPLRADASKCVPVKKGLHSSQFCDIAFDFVK
jgi:hypothetical protein